MGVWFRYYLFAGLQRYSMGTTITELPGAHCRCRTMRTSNNTKSLRLGLFFASRILPGTDTLIENTWKEQDSEYQEKKASLLVNLHDVRNVAAFFISPLYLFPIALAILLSSSYRLWTAAGILACVWSGLFIENTKAPHYVAASVGLVPLLVVYGLRWLRVIGREYGPVLVLTLAALLCLQGRAPEKGQSWETRSADAKSPRMLAMKEAMTEPRQQFILVRYSADHVDKSNECVYNSADIDSSQIVWAHDMGEAKNRELIDYYRGSRKVWLFQPDTKPGEIIPYVLGSE